MRTVRCTTPDCPSRGLVRTVPDRRAGPGVVYRPDLYCADCDAMLPDTGEASAAALPEGIDPRHEKAIKRPPETRGKRPMKRGG